WGAHNHKLEGESTMTIRKSFVLFITLAAIFVATQASAESRDRRNDYQGNSRSLESRLAALEDQVYELRRRVERCEGGNSGGYNPRPTGMAACLIQDTLSGAVFFGKGRVPVEAEQIARANCASNSSARFCSSQVRCLEARDVRPSVCILQDSLNGSSFKGEGESAIEAEYNARRACSSNSSARFCNTKATCQSY
ncbi:MAG: hypothetical protein ACM3MG_06525, partial [Bacillota bacterium]